MSRVITQLVLGLMICFVASCAVEEDGNVNEEQPDAGPSCDLTAMICDGSCVARFGDEHCGECDNTCEGDLSCRVGGCGCDDGLTRCNEQCLDSDGVCDVDMIDIAFDPVELTIEAGTTVRWTNLDQVGHTVTSGTASDPGAMFDSEVLDGSDVFEFTFEEPGVVPYFCRPHAGSMKAEVVVK